MKKLSKLAAVALVAAATALPSNSANAFWGGGPWYGYGWGGWGNPWHRPYWGGWGHPGWGYGHPWGYGYPLVHAPLVVTPAAPASSSAAE